MGYRSAAIHPATHPPTHPSNPFFSLWVLEPSLQLGIALWDLMVLGAPRWNKTGGPLIGANGLQEREFWRLGDMHIIRHLFSDWPHDYTHYRLWPWVVDERHGYPAGLRQLPMYAAMSDAHFAEATIDTRTRLPLAEGFIPALAPAHRPVWRALPIVYDQCISQCICLPWRWPAPGVFFSIHFSCLQGEINKPGHYPSEHAFMERLLTDHDCNRYHYLTWYETFKRAAGRLPPPLWEGADIAAMINMTTLNNPPTKIYEIKDPFGRHIRRRDRRMR